MTLSEIGLEEWIRSSATARSNRAKEDNQDADAESFELIFKFRCCGSDGYLARVDNTLQVRDTAIERLGAESYHLHVFDRPNERHVAIETRTAESRTRVFACSCVALEQK